MKDGIYKDIVGLLYGMFDNTNSWVLRYLGIRFNVFPNSRLFLLTSKTIQGMLTAWPT